MKILRLDQIGENIFGIGYRDISNKEANPYISLHLQKIHVISKVLKSKQIAT